MIHYTIDGEYIRKRFTDKVTLEEFHAVVNAYNEVFDEMTKLRNKMKQIKEIIDGNNCKDNEHINC